MIASLKNPLRARRNADDSLRLLQASTTYSQNVMMIPAILDSPLSVAFGSATDLGKRRDNNEDSSRCGLLAIGTSRESTLLVVSDGVGGSKAGEVASKLAVDCIHSLLAERLEAAAPPIDRRGWLDGAIRETDHRIRVAAEQPGLAGMGATLSVLWLAGREAWWGQAGDSRIYLWRRGELRQLSHDQSPVGRLRANGQLNEEQARAHPYRHLIDQCLGGAGAAIEPETGKFPLEPGDIFLLCSDGLSDGLWDRDLAEGLKLAAAGQSPAEVASILVARANEASGRDNITAVVARAAGTYASSSTEDHPPEPEGSPVMRLLRQFGWRRKTTNDTGTP